MHVMFSLLRLLSLNAVLLLTPVVKAQCPDYSIYSQQPHEPLSTGRYNLSYMRPEPACRTFNSSDVEEVIEEMKSVITDPDSNTYSSKV